MFKVISISLGRVKVGSKRLIVFPYSDIESFILVKASCDCTTLINDIPNQQIRVEYTAKPIPIQLKSSGTAHIVKSITVEYFKKNTIPLEKATTILSFNATVHE